MKVEQIFSFEKIDEYYLFVSHYRRPKKNQAIWNRNKFIIKPTETDPEIDLGLLDKKQGIYASIHEKIRTRGVIVNGFVRTTKLDR